MNTVQNETQNPAAKGEFSSRSTGFAIALAVACLVNAILVIAKESSPKVMAGMKHVTGHHWTTHALIALLVFVVLGSILSRVNGGKGLAMNPRRVIFLMAGGVILGGLIIAGFYLFGD